jgi:hypothetical protein
MYVDGVSPNDYRPRPGFPAIVSPPETASEYLHWVLGSSSSSTPFSRME